MFFASTVLQQMSSIRMAIQYRKGQPEVRNAFINASFLSLFLAFFTELHSPFAPDIIFTTNAVTQFLFQTLNAAVVGTAALSTLQGRALIESRRRDQHKESQQQNTSKRKYIKDLMVYVAPFFLNVPMNLYSTVLFFDPSHNRSWFLRKAVNSFGSSGISSVYYTLVFNNLVVGYGALAVTLRDKKLISKVMEHKLLALDTLFFVLSMGHLFVRQLLL